MLMGDKCARPDCGHDRISHGLFADKSCFYKNCDCKIFVPMEVIDAARIKIRQSEPDDEPKWEPVEPFRSDDGSDSSVGEKESSGEIPADDSDSEESTNVPALPDPFDRDTMDGRSDLPF
jgi:hypothetical protein